jgi:hypothetical protein
LSYSRSLLSYSRSLLSQAWNVCQPRRNEEEDTCIHNHHSAQATSRFSSLGPLLYTRSLLPMY